ncbi:YggT family protein [Wolbachia endosymbiont of Howardula sp.]|nr:YggT family protein [Wolbachia endosymbiont of Howardula sp.]UWI83389.1 YggT family protein [Wolbachia endosymbiont of Howardula sp.]
MAKMHVINIYSTLFINIMQILHQMINPTLHMIKKYIPSFNGLDISVLILIIAIHFIKYSITYYFQ